MKEYYIVSNLDCNTSNVNVKLMLDTNNAPLIISENTVPLHKLGTEVGKLNKFISDEYEKTQKYNIINSKVKITENTFMNSLFTNLFSWAGRFNRLQFFLYFLANLGISIGTALISLALIFSSDVGLSVLGMILLCIISFGSLYSNLAITAKRLHDLGFSGLHLIWMCLISMASSAFYDTSPTISIMLSIMTLGINLYLLFAPGQPVINQYGEISK